MKLPAKNIHKIAILRALKLGDMLCAIPAIKALRKAYPNAEIVLLGLPWAKIFAERFNMYIDRFMHFPGYKGLPEQPYNKNDFEDFIQAMRLENFDLVLQMQGNGTIVNPLMFLFDAKNVAGFYNKESYVQSELFLEYPDYGYEAQRHLLLMEHLGIKSQGADLEFPISEKDQQHFDELLLPLVNKNYICVHPGSADALRQWPPQFFAALADYCIEKNFTIVVTGTKEEQDITRELIKCIHHPVIDLTGKTDLGTVAVLIKNAFMLIANCTGVAHVAAAVKTQSVIISMDGEPQRWSPLNKNLHYVIDWTKEPHFEIVFNKMVEMIKKFQTSSNKKQLIKHTA
jgi:ADP-heptose:LPS heptosyltransferase